MGSVENVTSVLLNEPLLGVFSGDSLELAEFVGSCSSSGNSLAASSEADVEVHTENTSVGIVLNSEIDVFINTESEVAYNNKKYWN